MKYIGTTRLHKINTRFLKQMYHTEIQGTQRKKENIKPRNTLNTRNPTTPFEFVF